MISYSICLSLTYFPKQSTLQVHLYCCKWHNFILLFWLSTYIICIYVVYTYIYICLAGYSPWGCKESDTTERLSTAQTHTHTHTHIYIHISIYLSHIFFVHSSVHGHLGGFHISAIVKSLLWTLGCMHLLRHFLNEYMNKLYPVSYKTTDDIWAPWTT